MLCGACARAGRLSVRRDFPDLNLRSFRACRRVLLPVILEPLFGRKSSGRWRSIVPSNYRGVRRTAAIIAHPIHVMLVVFPVGFLVGTLATEIGFWRTGDPFWERGS
jgi:hypothetical protein